MLSEEGNVFVHCYIAILLSVLGGEGVVNLFLQLCNTSCVKWVAFFIQHVHLRVDTIIILNDKIKSVVVVIETFNFYTLYNRQSKPKVNNVTLISVLDRSKTEPLCIKILSKIDLSNKWKSKVLITACFNGIFNLTVTNIRIV